DFTGYITHFHSLDFSLRPGESLIYSWDTAKYYHYNFYTENNASMKDIGNGKFIYRTDFLNAPLNQLLNGFEGLKTSKDDGIKPNIHPATKNKTSSFVVKVTSPFAIVNATVTGSFRKE